MPLIVSSMNTHGKQAFATSSAKSQPSAERLLGTSCSRNRTMERNRVPNLLWLTHRRSKNILECQNSGTGRERNQAVLALLPVLHGQALVEKFSRLTQRL